MYDTTYVSLHWNTIRKSRGVAWNVGQYKLMTLPGHPKHNINLTIDFSTGGLRKENRLRSQRTPTTNKMKVSNCELIDLVIRIEFTRLVLVAGFSNFLKNSIIHFRMILYLETCFLRVKVSMLCRLQAVSQIHVPIHPYQISEGRRNCSTLWLA